MEPTEAEATHLRSIRIDAALPSSFIAALTAGIVGVLHAVREGWIR